MSMSIIKTLHDKRQRVESEARSIIDTAANEKRELTAEDDQKLATLDSESRTLADRIGDLLDAEERARAIDEKLSDYDKRASVDQQTTDPFVSELRSFFAGERRSLTISPEPRDLTKGTAAAGGHTVKTSFYESLVEHMIESSGVLASGATILRTTTGENIQIPVSTTHPTAVLVGEGAALTENDPVFAQRTVGAYKYGVMNQLSNELVTDTSVDLLGYLARATGRAVGNAFGAHAITGTGSSQPTGIVTSATTGVTGGTGVVGAFTADNLIDLFFSVIEPYRNDPSCGFLLKDSSVATMRKLKDTAGQYLWSPATEPGKPDTFLGKPVRSDPNVAATALSAKSVIFGAFSAYFVRQVAEIRFERSDEYAFANDLVTFRCLVRMDGLTVDQTGALKVFAGGAT